MVKQSQKEGMKKLLNKGFYEKKPAVLPNAYWKKSMCLKFTLLFFFQIILMYFFKIKPIAIFFFFLLFSFKIDVFHVQRGGLRNIELAN